MGKGSPLVRVGRLARALGFRWVFPVGTMAVPWHPAVLPFALAALTAWTVSRTAGLAVGAVDGAGGTVLGMAVGFIVVGLSMSVPVLAWLVLAFGGRLVQALLALAAMLVLGVSVATGEDPRWLAALPAAYVVAWATQAIGGRVLLARLRAAAARLDPVDVRGRVVVLPADLDAATAHDLLLRCGAGVVWVRGRGGGDGGRGRVVVTAEQAAQLRSAARDALPGDVRLEDVDGRSLLGWTGPLPSAGTVVVQRARRPDPGGLLGDGLWRTTVDGRTVVTGRAALVLPLPMLNAFHWVSLTSRNEWVVGFGRGRARTVGAQDGTVRHLFADGPPAGPGTGREVLSALDQVWRQVADRDVAVERLRSAALDGQVDLSAHRRAIDELRRNGAALLGADAAVVLAAWLERAREGRRTDEPAVVARLLDTLPDADLVRHGRRLLDVLNSRKLALRWDLGRGLDVTSLPRDLYRFGSRAGFGLALDLPGLYARLGDLVPPFRTLVAELGREMPLPDPILDAQRRWEEEGASEPSSP